MNEENKIGYYAIIPSTVLFCKELKANEKLLYAVITVLANKEGYCFASNAYLGNLLNSQPHTISRWVSHLKELNFVCLNILKNEKGEIIQRRIYPNDTPYTINRTYPYSINGIEGMSQKGQYNNISINKIDRLFNYIINNIGKIPEEFSQIDEKSIFSLLEKYELIYTKDNISLMSNENVEKLKYIIYAIALITRDNLQHLTNKLTRNKLIYIYNNCKMKENEMKRTNNKIDNFINYFYKSLVNDLTNENTFSLFNKNNNKEIGECDHEREII